MSDNQLKKSLYNSWNALLVVLKEVGKRYPFVSLLFFYLIFRAISFFFDSTLGTEITLTVLIGILSLGNYAKNKSFFESMLAFLLGILTIFSITWTKESAWVVGGSFFFFFVIFFMISTVSLSAKIESILTNAAGFMPGNHGENFKNLDNIVSEKSKYGQLHIDDRATSVAFFVYMKLPIVEMKDSLIIIESLKVVYQLQLNEALIFFRTITNFYKRYRDRYTDSLDWEIIFTQVSSLPISPQEFYQIFQASQRNLFAKYADLDTYFSELNNLIDQGLDNQSIIYSLNKE
jgi:hypothetical protein